MRTLTASLTLDRGDLILHSPYNRELVDGIKALPYNDRTWDKDKKVWHIRYMHGSTVAALVRQHLGYEIQVPTQKTYAADYVQTRLFRIEYIGSVQLRDDGTQTATGYVAGQWSVIFSQAVLLAWFGGEQKPGDAPTLFGVLGVKQDATLEEIKKAYRLAARTWHPDVNKEPNATEQFRRIQDAWEVLRDDQKKRKYLAGLKFAQDAGRQQPHQEFGWAPPVRCGLVVCECTESVGRFFIQKIISWGEIQDAAGCTMVSYWPKGADEFKTEFI